jgi:hypothetical protein
MEAPPASGVAAERTGVVVDGAASVRVDFALAAPTQGSGWTVKAEPGGGRPGFSVVRCQVEGEVSREVRLWTAGWSGIVQRTGSKTEYGPDVCEFAPLGAGRYIVEAMGLEAATGQTMRIEVNLEPESLLWVRYRKAAPAPVEPPKRSVIEGSVANADGRTVRLTWPGGQQQTTVKDGRYRFAGLGPGVYRVAVLATDPAAGEAAVQDAITLDGTNQATADFALSAMRSDSVIGGRVKGGAGRTIKLEGPNVSRTATVAADETYRFVNLPAGTYILSVLDSDPPTGTTQTQSDISVDGANAAQVDLDLTSLGPAKTMDHYLLVGSIARSKDDFVTTLQYIGRFQPAIGTDEAEARKAHHVTILGSLSAISALVEQGLRMAGCRVRRVESDYAEALGRLLTENRPY